jgi:hypothetical protein
MRRSNPAAKLHCLRCGAQLQDYEAIEHHWFVDHGATLQSLDVPAPEEAPTLPMFDLDQYREEKRVDR